MSLKTWVKEFYQLPAGQTMESEAITHSIHKWTGLLPKNLERHNVERVHSSIRSKGLIHIGKSTMEINSTTCALCFHYYDRPNVTGDGIWDTNTGCASCPLYKVRNTACCSNNHFSEPMVRPYDYWQITGDPGFILRDLCKAVLLAAAETALISAKIDQLLYRNCETAFEQQLHKHKGLDWIEPPR